MRTVHVHEEGVSWNCLVSTLSSSEVEMAIFRHSGCRTWTWPTFCWVSSEHPERETGCYTWHPYEPWSHGASHMTGWTMHDFSHVTAPICLSCPHPTQMCTLNSCKNQVPDCSVGKQLVESISLDASDLVRLPTGTVAPPAVVNDLLRAFEVGEEKYQTFKQTRLDDCLPTV